MTRCDAHIGRRNPGFSPHLNGAETLRVKAPAVMLYARPVKSSGICAAGNATRNVRRRAGIIGI
jgi:hypothetical protein